MAIPDKNRPDTAVRVQSGDTLSAIAKANNLTLSEIKALNPQLVENPKYQGGNKIFSNTLINIAPRETKAITNLDVTPTQPTYIPTEEPIIISGGNLTAIPPTPLIDAPVYAAPPPVKTATLDIILFDEESVPTDGMFDQIFENIGGQELISITRSDIVNGQKISYQPIKNLSAIQQRYNPNNILSLQQTADKFFAGFSIKLEDKIPETGNGTNGENIYLNAAGDLVIEFINVNPDEQVETQISVSGTIYEADLGDYTS